MKTLIPATTKAATHIIYIQSDNWVSIAHDGLTGIEELSVEIDLDGTWTPVTPPIVLSESNNYMQLSGPNSYRLVKPVTANPVAIFESE